MKRALTAVVVAALAVQPAAATAAERPGLSLKVSVSAQTMTLYEGRRAVRTYPISTSKYGTGNKLGSLKTPLGRHRIARKIGGGAPLNTVFRNRVNTRVRARIDRTSKGAPEDLVTTRILWLEGLERGVNRGGRIDSFRRLIYIHGTPSEGLIGKPASNGCIRMTNEDVAELYDRVDVGTPVLIGP
ncbi:MAG: hypothetical protein MOGMAGMI_01520 [Candidatus Omnitrophica bacterium]|nr:hypothetical protein [Candidatus Omnitrophota bacterium]